MRMFGMIGRIAYAPEGVSEGAAQAGTNPAVAAAPAGVASEHPIVAPWAAANGVWNFGEGEAAKPWWSTINEQPVRDLMEAKRYANPAELAMAYHNLNKLQNGAPDILTMPGKDATPEQWNAFYSKLGRPEAPEKYDLKFGDGVQADEKLVDFGRKMFFEMGLSTDRAQKAADMWNTFVAEQNASAAAAAQSKNQAEIEALNAKYGADADKNRAAGLRVIQALGLDEATLNRVEGALGAAPLIELLVNIGRKSDEGGFMAGGVQADPNNPATMNPTQAAARIAQLRDDAEFQKKYTDRNHPGHKDALALMERLFSRV